MKSEHHKDRVGGSLLTKWTGKLGLLVGKKKIGDSWRDDKRTPCEGQGCFLESTGKSLQDRIFPPELN